METHLDCVPCLLRQAVDAVKLATSDPELQRRVLRAVLDEIARLDYTRPAPLLAGRLHQVVCQQSGNPDPYLPLKERCNRLALDRLPALHARVAAAANPFDTAVRVAIAGNLIDFSVRAAGDDLVDELDRAVDQALGDGAAPSDALAVDIAALGRAADRAESILYLCDNAGEIVFDRPLLERLGWDARSRSEPGAAKLELVERLPPGRVTIAAKAGPAVNDATVADAMSAGIDQHGALMSTGSRYPGTVLSDCSTDFRDRFAAADLIIAKGQANYETLVGSRAGIFFLFRVKCQMVAAAIGAPVGSWIATPGAAGHPDHSTG